MQEIPKDAIRVMPDVLRKMTVEILLGVHLPQSDAEQVADCLVSVDNRGIFSHGTRQLKRYVGLYKGGTYNPQPTIKVIQEAGSTAVMDGGGGIGYLAAMQATELAMQKAESHGIAAVSACNLGHSGSMGIYARMALERNLATILCAGGGHWKPRTGQDETLWESFPAPPLGIGIPTSDGPPVVLDMSVNMFAMRNPEALGKALATYPDPVFKSLGLKFACGLLGGILGGGMAGHQESWSTGFLVIALQPGALGDGDGYLNEVARIVSRSMALPPLPGQEAAEIPGSREWRRENEWAQEGIPIGAGHRKQLEDLATEFGIDVPW